MKCKRVAFCYNQNDIEKAPPFMRVYMQFVKRCCNGNIENGKCDNEEMHCKELGEVIAENSDGIYWKLKEDM